MPVAGMYEGFPVYCVTFKKPCLGQCTRKSHGRLRNDTEVHPPCPYNTNGMVQQTHVVPAWHCPVTAGHMHAKDWSCSSQIISMHAYDSVETHCYIQSQINGSFRARFM